MKEMEPVAKKPLAKNSPIFANAVGTANMAGVNWADPRDNFVDDWFQVFLLQIVIPLFRLKRTVLYQVSKIIWEPILFESPSTLTLCWSLGGILTEVL
jgi:hypothetical protein